MLWKFRRLAITQRLGRRESRRVVMSAGRRVWGAFRALSLRTRPPPHPRARPFWQSRAPTRFYSDDADGPPPKPITPADSLEAPGMTDTGGNMGITSQDAVPEGDSMPASGAPGDSYLSDLDDKNLEKVLYGGRAPKSGSEAGLTPTQEEILYREGSIPSAEEAEAIEAERQDSQPSSELVRPSNREMKSPGHKFGLPPRPYPADFHLRKRYHPVLEQLTRLLMRDGKLSVAQRTMAMAMNVLRSSPAPIYNPKCPLLPGTPPASHLPLNPILYITIALDSVAPLIRIRYFRGAAGGGRALEVPMPLALRQRRRTAFKWILDTVDKKPSRGSGRGQLPHRIAEEIIAVVEGRSGAWEKRRQVHKLGMVSRANVGSHRLQFRKARRW